MKYMKYFFVFGSHPDLSLAELTAVLGDGVQYLNLSAGVLVVEAESLDLASLHQRLGGTVKMGEVYKLIPNLSESAIKTGIKEILAMATKPFFGISLYGGKFKFQPLALSLKKEIKINDRAPRYVVSKEAILSSVVVEQNKLTSGGAEIVIAKCPQGFWLGRTSFVQPFKELSARDYGRPDRDDQSGMLPPKLAQMMINLAGADTNRVLLDPFCGSGTIVSEALLMGFGRIIGSDISEKAIADSKNNLAWLRRHYNLTTGTCQLHVMDATKLASLIPLQSLDLIVTEPYLGPQRGARDLDKVKQDLDKLYSDAIAQFAQVLKPGGKLVMIWPRLLRTAKVFVDITPSINGFEQSMPWPKALEMRQPQTLLYGREGQSVWRRIVILVKK